MRNLTVRQPRYAVNSDRQVGTGAILTTTVAAVADHTHVVESIHVGFGAAATAIAPKVVVASAGVAKATFYLPATQGTTQIEFLPGGLAIVEGQELTVVMDSGGANVPQSMLVLYA